MRNEYGRDAASPAFTLPQRAGVLTDRGRGRVSDLVGESSTGVKTLLFREHCAVVWWRFGAGALSFVNHLDTAPAASL